MVFEKKLFSGNSRRKVSEIILSLYGVEQVDDLEWHCRVVVTGDNHRDATVKGCSAFDALATGMSFLRQSLRMTLRERPETKFYEDLDGELFEVTIDAVFGTEDCVPEDLQIAYEWAKRHGYESD